MSLDRYAAVRSKESVEEHAASLGEKVKTLDDYLELIRKGLKGWKTQGVVGLKMKRRLGRHVSPRRSWAVALFDKLMRSGPHDRDCTHNMHHLYSFIAEEIMDMAAELRLVVAIHTGTATTGDFRGFDPVHVIPILGRHPRTRFDIYRMGIPYIRETAIIGKNFPNVWLNFCWTHIISPKIACLAMDELIDLVPVNKIVAFGGDYRIPVEKVYGHLVMARENAAKVLGQRVEDGLLTENEAIEIARKWFYGNPKELYRLKI